MPRNPKSSTRRRAAAAGILLILCALLGEWALGPRPHLVPVTYDDLDGWRDDDHVAAWRAFVASCRRAAAPSTLLRAPCADASTLPAAPTRDQARTFFERAFHPHAIMTGTFLPRSVTGLFTGYYQPDVRGALQPDATYSVPLYGVPNDMVTLDPSIFDPAYADKTPPVRWVGRVRKNRVEPYPARAAIEAHGLDGVARPLVYLASAADAFFVHVQGSAKVTLAEGGTLYVGYAARNGHPYTAIGKVLIQRGALPPHAVSMQSIRDWLQAHPSEAADVMAQNASYIFFAERAGAGHGDHPVGAAGVTLTPERSLAVDPAHVDLGLPLWVETTTADGMAFRRLMVAQDTGAAIRGIVRGDIYFGTGDDAGARAGTQKQKGTQIILLPRDTDTVAWMKDRP